MMVKLKFTPHTLSIHVGEYFKGEYLDKHITTHWYDGEWWHSTSWGTDRRVVEIKTIIIEGRNRKVVRLTGCADNCFVPYEYFIK